MIDDREAAKSLGQLPNAPRTLSGKEHHETE
jgi:hypothetical protein